MVADVGDEIKFDNRSADFQLAIMSKNNGKRGRGSKIAVEHGVQSSWIHWVHSQQSKARQKIVYVAHEVVDGSDYPKFISNLTGLGKGRNWIIEGNEMKITDGEAWVRKMYALMDHYNWYHQRMRTKIKKGKNPGETKIRYTKRKMADRKKLSKTDKRSRPDTDLMRETIDLRPDHSRVLEGLLAKGRLADLIPILDQIQKYQIQLFEKIYEGRKIVSEGEHVDAGQYHFDHWHTGVEITKVDDHGAVVELLTNESNKQQEEEILVEGQEKVVRLRKEFRSFGVGDGMASFDRHRAALAGDGRDARTIMGYTHEKLMMNIELVTKKNEKRLNNENRGEDATPRDIRMWRAVDCFVEQKLRELDPELCDKARKDYAVWIQDGYELEQLGIRQETIQVTQHKKRKEELSRLKSAARSFVELLMRIPGVMQIIQSNKVLAAMLDEVVEMVLPETKQDLSKEDAPPGLER